MSSNPVRLGGAARLPAAMDPASAQPARAHRPETAAFAPLLHRAATGPPARVTMTGKAPPRAPAGRSADDVSHRKHQGPDAALQCDARQASLLAPPSPLPPIAVPPATTAAAAAEGRVRASLEDLLPALVRKVAWSGDARSGSVVLELGAGALTGARLLVQAESGRVRVQLSAPPWVDLDGWRTRLATRLAARGLDVTGVDVLGD